MVISIAIIVVMLAVMLGFFWSVTDTHRQSGQISDRTNLARSVVAKIEAELKGCIGFDRVGFPVEQRLAGTRREITFLSSAMPDKDSYVFRGADDTPPPGAHDLRQVGYSLWIDPENKTEDDEPIVGGIIRTEKRTLNQFLVEEDDPLDIRHDLWAAELGYLEFRYFDGVEWDTKWDVTNGNSLPQLIQITVGYKSITQEELDDIDLDSYPIADFPFGDDEHHPDRYSTIVRIPSAARTMDSRFEKMGKSAGELFGVGGTP